MPPWLACPMSLSLERLHHRETTQAEPIGTGTANQAESCRELQTLSLGSSA